LQGKFEQKEDEDDDGAYKNEEDEAPTVNLNNQDKVNNPFEKLFDKNAEKFKYFLPAEKSDDKT